MFESAFMKPRLSQDEAVESNPAVYTVGQLLLGWSFERWWSRMPQWECRCLEPTAVEANAEWSPRIC